MSTNQVSRRRDRNDQADSYRLGFLRAVQFYYHQRRWPRPSDLSAAILIDWSTASRRFWPDPDSRDNQRFRSFLFGFLGRPCAGAPPQSTLDALRAYVVELAGYHPRPRPCSGARFWSFSSAPKK